MAVVHTRYYTDPACPWSWGLEPSLRRLMVEFGNTLEFEYVMAGMSTALDDPPAFVLTVLEAAHETGMPVDVRLWLKDPPGSSHGACMAVKAAGEQGDPAPYLRRLREGFFCRGRRLDSADVLRAEARALPELDLERFRIDLASHGVLELLAGDLERAGNVSSEQHSSGEDRVKLPSLEFVAPGGEVTGVYGFSNYEELREAALAAGAVAQDGEVSIDQALARFGTMTTAEVAAVCGLPGPTAPARLWQMASEWRIQAEPCGGGQLWSLA
jgi:predicted DsbA family dithiol-disulfide isomerase